MKLQDIQNMPTTHDNFHESILRSYHILEYVLGMVERGDSKETILDVVEILQEAPYKGQSQNDAWIETLDVSLFENK